MFVNETQIEALRAATSFALPVPGSDRRRGMQQYHFRVTYRCEDFYRTGCIITWEVTGGRLPYQAALERTASGNYFWHCTCADAVFRCEPERRHCKHIRALTKMSHFS